MVKKIVVSILAAVVVAIVGFALKDAAIGRFVVPAVAEYLGERGYFREEVKEGSFVATSEIAFADNELIDAGRLRQLDRGEFAIADSVNRRLRSIEVALTELLQSKAILEAAVIDEAVEITLFISDRQSEEGLLILNRRNPAIARLILNQADYCLSGRASGSRVSSFTVLLEDVHASGFDDMAPIGRLYRTDYHRMFPGHVAADGDGVTRARVLLTPPADLSWQGKS